MAKKKKVKRSMLLIGKGEVHNILDLSKVVEIRTEVEMIHLDKLKDGTWRLTYSNSTIPDIKDLETLQIVRED